MNSRTLLRRTPTGDAEVVVPASGLSVTQRRILRLLDQPARLGDLHVGRSLESSRLAHEAVLLQRAGLIRFEVTRDPRDLAAANAATIRTPARPLARPLPIAVVFVAASVVVWAGWRYNSSPAAPSDNRRHVGTSQTSDAPNRPSPEASKDPPVIATRVLKGEVTDRNRDAKDRTAARTAAASATTEAAAVTSMGSAASRTTAAPASDDARAADPRTPLDPPDP